MTDRKGTDDTVTNQPVTSETFATNEPVDLTNCDREPIHIPGRIQSHGLLLVLRETDLTILQVSNNSDAIVGVPIQNLLQHPISVLIDGFSLEQINKHLVADSLKYTQPLKFQIPVRGEIQEFDGIIHAIDGVFILELERVTARPDYPFADFYSVMRTAIFKLQQAETLLDMSRNIAVEVRRITGFDRVLVYQFDSEGNGEVIAEDKTEGIESYLGLHYPASDIPRQARRLYILNWLRLIADVNYQPSDILPVDNPVTGGPLNLSYSVLRSVSPIHIEYLKNMGVSASMSISIVKYGNLWGLIACHHYAPRYLPYTVRIACEFLAQIFSLNLVNIQSREDSGYELYLKSLLVQYIEHTTGNQNFIDELIKLDTRLIDLAGAQGVALCFDGDVTLIGSTPDASQVQGILEWLNANVDHPIFQTDELSVHYSPAHHFKDTASGLLSAAFSQSQKHYILWFRPEVLQVVKWSGNPEKSVIADESGLRLLPRKSFDLWQQIKEGHSLPWLGCEIETVEEFREAIVNLILRNVNALAQMNAKLERSNSELDAFAHIASHDLKEPLRGLHNYASFLMEDYADKLDADGVNKLQTMVRLTQRMEDLINSLLHFSRVGRVDLSMGDVDLNDVLAQVIDMLSVRIQEIRIALRIPRRLPTLWCDRVHVAEVFNNLITNAFKYNDKADKWIEVGYVDEPHQPITFYVRDNGIGIQEKHLDTIFLIFKRLHGRDEFGGGTGSGLTIVKKIVERHGGRIWVESVYGEGTTFYFTLSPAPTEAAPLS